jgi:hypothetical protein
VSTTTRRAVSCLAALLMLSFGTASAFRQGRLIGKVMDAKGKPIAGVRVTTTSKALPDFKVVTETDGKGVFKVDFERIGVVYVYELEKVGYAPLRVEQNWTVADTDRHDFQMVESGAPALGEIGAPASPAAAAGTAPGADAAAAPAEPSSPAVGAFNEGVRAFKAKDYDTAAARLQEAATQYPSLRQAWVALSATYMQQRKYPQAAEAAEKAIALGATEASVLETRWDAYRQMGDKARTAKAR